MTQGQRQMINDCATQASQEKEMFLTCGTWVAQQVECPILDFGEGHDVGVMIVSPTLDSTLIVESA